MNLFKSTIFASVLALGVAMTACNDDSYWSEDPDVADGFSFRQTSVSATCGDTVTAAPVTVNVMRGKLGVGQVIINQATSTPEVFSVPSVVAFDTDSYSSDITVQFKGNLPAGTYTDTLSIAPASISGVSQIVVTLTVKGAVEPADWQPIGEATYREDFMTTFYNVDNLTYKVPMEEDKNHPGVYRLVNPYGELYPYNEPGDYDETKDHYMVINASDKKHVYIERHYSGMDWGYGEVVMFSFAGYYTANGKTVEEIVEMGDYFGTLQNGVITFPTNALLVGMTKYNGGGLYAANAAGKFAVALPGVSLGDFTFEASYLGQFISVDGTEYAVGQASFGTKQLGKDVAYVVAGFVSTDTVAASGAPAYVKGGLVPTDTLSASGSFRLPIEHSGKYTMVVVSFDADSAAQETYTEAIKFTLTSDLAVDENAGWKELGNATITDRLLDGTFNVPEFSYEAPVQEKEDTPGYYRLVNPYGVYYPLNDEGDYDATSNYYVEIDATNPDCVFIPLQETGMNWGYGNFGIMSMSYNMLMGGKTVDEIIEAGAAGTLKNNVISFPIQGIICYIPDLDQLRYGANKGTMDIVLPGAEAPAATMIARKAAPVSRSFRNSNPVVFSGHRSHPAVIKSERGGLKAVGTQVF